jgi:tRNA threonylcarbamoyladenosine biosynthesis protein TsaB
MCSVAWWIEDNILLDYNIESANNHAALLPELLSEGFNKVQYKPSDINLICVTSGPGSFTGLRIGMAYAKGLCYGLNIPIIALTNFEILALQAPAGIVPIYTIIDARRGNVYLGSFLKDNKTLNATSVVSITEFKEMLSSQSILVVHDRLDLDESLLDGYEGKVLDGTFDVGLLCKFGYHKYQSGYRVDLETLEPLYIQQFAGMK